MLIWQGRLEELQMHRPYQQWHVEVNIHPSGHHALCIAQLEMEIA